jgi:hypothetical protein
MRLAGACILIPSRAAPVCLSNFRPRAKKNFFESYVSKTKKSES